MKFQLARGGLFGFAQAILTAGVQLLVIKLVLFYWSIEYLGVWSLVGAFCAPLRLFDFAGSTTAYFVAKSQSDGSDYSKTSRYLVVNVLLSFLFLFLSVLVTIFAATLVMDSFFSVDAKFDVALLLPLVATTMAVTSLQTNIAAAYDGLQESYKRSQILIAGQLIYLALSLLLVSKYGLFGLAFSQLVGASVMSVVAVIMLNRRLRLSLVFKNPAISEVAPEIIKYGLKVKAVGWGAALFEPGVRILIGSNGGIAVLGLYELAQRVILQVRMVANQALYPLIPAITHLYSANKSELKLFIGRWYIYCSLGGILFVAGSGVGPVMVERILLGYYSEEFRIMFFILVVPSAFAISVFPLHYIGPATSNLTWNGVGHSFALVLVVLIAGLRFQDGQLIVLMVSAAFVFGYLVAVAGNSLRLELFGLKNAAVFFVSTFLIVSISLLYVRILS